MKELLHYVESLLWSSIVFCLSLNLVLFIEMNCKAKSIQEVELREGPYGKSEIDLKAIPYKIIYETYRETDGQENWELFLMNADGSNTINLTRTKDLDELYPHASPDGSKVCFVIDQGTGRNKTRDIYYMNTDGTNRTKIADNARQPCWSPDGKTIAYVKGEYERYSNRDYATKGLFFYDLSTGTHKEHPNEELHHIYNICWSPEGKWFVATVSGGMGFDHTIIAFEAHGPAVFDLKKHGIEGCRPDLSPDGRLLGWAEISEVDVYVADIDLSLSLPRVANLRGVAKCEKGHFTNHTDFSPDGRYIAFSSGPEANYSVGHKTPGCNICIGDLTGKWVQITTDGKHNKEPDWVPIGPSGR